MREIEFCAGYHEWCINIDNNVVYSISNIENDIEDGWTFKMYECFATEIIADWREECKEQGKDYPLTTEETDYLIDEMANTLACYYGFVS